MGQEGFASVSAVWPLREERVANRVRWEEFWKQGRASQLQRLLREHGASYGFSDDAFLPFFENLNADPRSEQGLESLEVFSRLKERFVQEGQSGYRVLSFFPDEDRFVSQLSEVSERHRATLFPGPFPDRCLPKLSTWLGWPLSWSRFWQVCCCETCA